MPAAQWAELDGRRDKFQWAIFRYSQVASTIDVAGKTAAKACEGAFLAANSITAAYDSCWRILNTPMPFAVSFLALTPNFKITLCVSNCCSISHTCALSFAFGWPLSRGCSCLHMGGTLCFCAPSSAMASLVLKNLLWKLNSKFFARNCKPR